VEERIARLNLYLSDERFTYTGPRHRRRQQAIADTQAVLEDILALHDRLRDAERGFWGSPCEKHSNTAGFLARVPVDADGLHCFGCWVEVRENAAREEGRVECSRQNSYAESVREKKDG